MELLDPAPDPVPESAVEPLPQPPPASRFTTGQTLLLVGLVVVAIFGAALAVLVILFLASSPSRLLSGSPRTEQRVVSRLDYDSGRSDTIGHEFDVPRGCTKIILYYEGEPNDRGIDVAWVGFRIYDEEIADYSIDSSGPHDLLESDTGSSRLTLPAGSTYYVETSSFNADWSYRINCE